MTNSLSSRSAQRSSRALVAVGVAILVVIAVCAATAQPAAAYSASEQRVISFVSAHVDTAIHVADTAGAAASANGRGRWVRATELIRHSSKDYARLHKQWWGVPEAGGAVTRLERQFDALQNNIGIYGECVAKSIAGDGSYANVNRGLKAWDRALNNLSNVLVELAVLE